MVTRTRPIPPITLITDFSLGVVGFACEHAASVALSPVPNVVQLREAVCLLGRFPALAGLDLELDAGGVTLLSGPNGAGKTTLLRLLAGLLPLHSGTGSVFGSNLNTDRVSHRRRLALVGHDTFCYDDLTVRENLVFSAKASGRKAATGESAMERLGLTHVSGVLHSRLSAGQRRRLALAAALGRDPELLLLDEPHAGLDSEGREILDEILRDTYTSGRTVIMASHELDRTRALADKEISIRGGRAYSVEQA